MSEDNPGSHSQTPSGTPNITPKHSLNRCHSKTPVISAHEINIESNTDNCRYQIDDDDENSYKDKIQDYWHHCTIKPNQTSRSPTRTSRRGLSQYNLSRSLPSTNLSVIAKIKQYPTIKIMVDSITRFINIGDEVIKKIKSNFFFLFIVCVIFLNRTFRIFVLFFYINFKHCNFSDNRYAFIN